MLGDFERWIYVLKNMDTLDRLPFKARKAVFAKLEQIVDIAALSKEERMRYDESIKVYRDHLATIAYAKTEGRAEGRAEAMLDTARNLLAKGFDLDVVADVTGLSVEEIKSM